MFVPGLRYDWAYLQSPFYIWSQGLISRVNGSGSALSWFKDNSVLVVVRSGYFWQAGAASDSSTGPGMVSLL